MTKLKDIINEVEQSKMEDYLKRIGSKVVTFSKDPNNFKKGYNGGNTRWIDKTMMSKKDAMNIMSQALPNGYNEFTPKLIDKLPSDSKIQLAREGSVCLYVTTNTKPSKASLKADELDMVGNNTYRIWWD